MNPIADELERIEEALLRVRENADDALENLRETKKRYARLDLVKHENT
jgi:Mg2+ and Co2+ transporter CorA